MNFSNASWYFGVDCARNVAEEMQNAQAQFNKEALKNSQRTVQFYRDADGSKGFIIEGECRRIEDE